VRVAETHENDGLRVLSPEVTAHTSFAWFRALATSTEKPYRRVLFVEAAASFV
jgi:hypothetical protein